MRVKILTAICLTAFIAMIAAFAIADEKAAAKHEFIGEKKCKICHKKDGTHPSWLETSHATAFDNLTPEQQKDPAYIKYYTTGTDAKGELLTGVQCEACHGAGADYKAKKIMEDREQAIANGLLIPDEKTCLTCHNADAPGKLGATAKDWDFAKAKAKGVHAMPEAAEETE
ncbi:MAG: cytochrome c family protein [candidate division Zixibacteria bacterium]|nr:cytochrome c family protein [candidate division Zixibacteria bacterium]